MARKFIVVTYVVKLRWPWLRPVSDKNLLIMSVDYLHFFMVLSWSRHFANKIDLKWEKFFPGWKNVVKNGYFWPFWPLTRNQKMFYQHMTCKIGLQTCLKCKTRKILENVVTGG